MDNCYNTNPRKSLPAAVSLEQEERLSRRHIQTLSFTQDIAKQNKVLLARIEELEQLIKEKEELIIAIQTHSQDSEVANMHDKIKELEELYNKRVEELSKSWTTKHQEAIEAMIDEKANTEKLWLSEKQNLLAKIAKLELDFRDFKIVTEKGNSELNECQNQLKQKEFQLNEVTKEKEAAEKLCSNMNSQVEQIKIQKSAIEELKQEIGATKQQKIELEFKIEQLRLDRDNDSKVELEQQKVISKLKATASGNDAVVKRLQERLKYVEQDILQLQTRNEHLQTEIDTLRAEKSSLINQLQRKDSRDSSQSIGSSGTNKLGSNSDGINFHEYVNVKREVTALRNENSLLKTRLKSAATDISKPKIANSR